MGRAPPGVVPCSGPATGPSPSTAVRSYPCSDSFPFPSDAGRSFRRTHSVPPGRRNSLTGTEVQLGVAILPWILDTDHPWAAGPMQQVVPGAGVAAPDLRGHPPAGVTGASIPPRSVPSDREPPGSARMRWHHRRDRVSAPRGRSSEAEHQLPKLRTRVRFPSPALANPGIRNGGHELSPPRAHSPDRVAHSVDRAATVMDRRRGGARSPRSTWWRRSRGTFARGRGSARARDGCRASCGRPRATSTG